MSNRQLTAAELKQANALLDEIRDRLERLSAGDPALLFAFRRKVFKELTYDERSSPTERNKLKARKMVDQRGLCTICGKPMPEKYNVLDRLRAEDGYTAENTRLIHAACDTEVQKSRGYR